MPELLRPTKGRYGLTDYEKAFSSILRSGEDIYAQRGIDRQSGCLVVVRPDQYVAQVLPLDGIDELGAYFETFLQDVRDGAQAAAGAASVAIG